jgi:Fe-S oxidoreductase/nitrate reductase gamma subunit
MTLAETATRETFANLPVWAIAFWYFLIFVSTAIFAYGVYRLARKYRQGRGPVEPDRPAERLARTAKIVFTHSWIRRRDPLSGFAHLFVFYGFLVLFVGTAILAVQDDIAEPIGFEFFTGWFYKGYSLFLDVFGAVLVVGLVLLAVRRGIMKPFRLSYWRPDRQPGEPGFDRSRYVRGDWLFLGLLFFLALTGFLLEAFRIAETDPSFETWSPVGWIVGQGFIDIGFDGGAAETAHRVNWWVHGLVALAFVASIPFTKAVHMIAGPAGVAERDEKVGRRLAPIPADAASDEVGYQFIRDLAPRHLLDLDACTKCGKCHAACPATASGYPLSPRDLILDLREVAEGSIGIRAALDVQPLYDPARSILGDPIRPETLWSCMQCMACVEICPVGIEHVPIINEMRRGLVERGEMDGQLQSTLETIYTSGNSFGEPKRKRSRWAKELGFDVKDARKEPVEYLWFVGDYASFDPRNQKVTQALARILHHAGVDFGILFDAERTAGNDVRRAGEEGLYSSLAEENIKALEKCDFERILSSDPHTFNTLRNEYPELGASWTADDVVHHSQLLRQLLDDGTLVPSRRLDYRVTYHDPCHLGRYNKVYEAPREVMTSLGIDLVEMPRNRDNSFCCGAGGGRIWMKELKREDAQRPSENRIDEAVGLGQVQYFTVACPKDVTMYEDAIKTSGHGGEIELRELSELVLEALDLEPVGATETPAADAGEPNNASDA